MTPLDLVLQPPPRRSDPRSFYLEYLPAVWTAVSDGFTPVAIDLELEYRVASSGHEEAFTLAWVGGRLEARASAASSALLSFAFDREAWRVAALDVLPRVIKKLPALTERRRAELQALMERRAHGVLAEVRGLPGRLEIELTDDAGDLSRYEVTVASGAGPTARVALSDADVWHLAETGGSGLSRAIRTRVHLSGEIGYALRLIKLLEL